MKDREPLPELAHIAQETAEAMRARLGAGAMAITVAIVPKGRTHARIYIGTTVDDRTLIGLLLAAADQVSNGELGKRFGVHDGDDG